MHYKILRILLSASGLLFAGIIIITLALTPNLLEPGYHTDKVLHLITFYIASLIIGLKYIPKIRWIIVIATSLFMFGLCIEFIQYIVDSGRLAQWEDVASNALGIALGITNAYLLKTGYYAKCSAR